MFRFGAVMMAAALALPVAADEGGGCGECCQAKKKVAEFRFHGPVGDNVGHLGVGLSDDKDGPRVDSVSEGSPAEKAGFKKGDLIVRFQGEPAVSARKIVRLVQETPPGRAVKVEVQRDGKPLTLEATLDQGRTARLHELKDLRELKHLRDLKELKDLPQVGELRGLDKDVRFFLSPQPRRLGLRYQEISGQLARYFHVERGSALLVTEVTEDSPAAKAGVKAGDVLLSIGGRDIEDADDLRRQVAEASGELRLKVLRDGKALELTATLPARPSGSKETL